VKVKLTEDELDKAFGQLSRYRKTIDKSSWVSTLDYGIMMAGPEEVYLYICCPNSKYQTMLDLAKDEGYGLLTFEHDLTINEILPPVNQTELKKLTIMSTKNKCGRRFRIAVKHHMIFGKLFHCRL